MFFDVTPNRHVLRCYIGAFKNNVFFKNDNFYFKKWTLFGVFLVVLLMIYLAYLFTPTKSKPCIA